MRWAKRWLCKYKHHIYFLSEGFYNLSEKQLRYSWYGQILPGQMLPGQISLWQLESIQYGPGNLPLKFGQNRVNNSWYFTDIEFAVVGGWVEVVVLDCKVIFISNPPGYFRFRLTWVFIELGLWQLYTWYFFIILTTK